MFSYSDSTVVTPSGQIVRLAYPVQQLLEDVDVAYVVLDTPPAMQVHDNVVCISQDGRLLWTIENKLHGSGDTYYEGRIRLDGKLEFWNSDSVWLWVDKGTGNLIAARVERFGPYAEKDGDWDRNVHFYRPFNDGSAPPLRNQ